MKDYSIDQYSLDDIITLMAPLIGITAGEIHNKLYEWSPTAHGQNHTYIDAVVRAGGIPVIIPIIQDKHTLKGLFQRLDGILLAGGNDINPRLYDEKPHHSTKDVSELRDATEVQLLELSLENKKPLLCICRGMQLLNVTCGGSLYQHLAEQLPGVDHEASTHHKDSKFLAHDLNIVPDTKLASILAITTIKANAHHHQGIKKLGQGLRPSAHTTDGLIEAVESDNNHFVIGVQSHPESLEGEVVPEWRLLFESFVEACR